MMLRCVCVCAGPLLSFHFERKNFISCHILYFQVSNKGRTSRTQTTFISHCWCVRCVECFDFPLISIEYITESVSVLIFFGVVCHCHVVIRDQCSNEFRIIPRILKRLSWNMKYNHQKWNNNLHLLNENAFACARSPAYGTRMFCMFQCKRERAHWVLCKLTRSKTMRQTDALDIRLTNSEHQHFCIKRNKYLWGHHFHRISHLFLSEWSFFGIIMSALYHKMIHAFDWHWRDQLFYFCHSTDVGIISILWSLINDDWKFQFMLSIA